MNFERVKKLSFYLFLLLCISFIIYIFMKYIFVLVLPFLVGWFIAFLLRPASITVARRLKIKTGIVRVILTVLLLAIAFGLSVVAVWLLSREVWELISGIDNGKIESIISEIVGTDGLFGRIFGNFSDYIADGIYSVAMSFLSSLGSALSSFAAAVPGAVLFVIITVISSLYFALELEYVNSAIKNMLPCGIYNIMVKLKDGFLSVFTSYIKAYLLLLLITFGEMLLGLSVLRVDYPLIMAILIAMLDLLPILGVGTVLVPWGAWYIIDGSAGQGIGLLLLFAVHTVFRQMIEPKIVGKNIGVHPILTLLFLYVGYSLFGFVGLIAVPVLSVLVNFILSEKNSAEIS